MDATRQKLRHALMLVWAALMGVTTVHAYTEQVTPDCDFTVNDVKYNFAYDADVPLVNIVALNNAPFKKHVTYEGKKYVVGGYDLNFKGTPAPDYTTVTTTGCATLYLSEYMEPFSINYPSFKTYVFTNEIITPSVDFWLRLYTQSHNARYLNHVRDFSKDAIEITQNSYCETNKLCQPVSEGAADYAPITSITIPQSYLNRDLSGCLDNYSTITEADLSAIDMEGSNITMTNCSNLQKVILNQNTLIIPDRAFNLCSRLEDITLPESVMTIGDEAFWADSYGNTGEPRKLNTGRLKSINCPTALSNIGDRAFSDNSLEEVVLGNNVRSIGAEAFSYNEPLKRVKIGDGVTTLNGCFSWCKALEEVSIGSRVESLGSYEFRGTTDRKLRTIECLNPIPPTYDVSALPFDDYVYDAATLYVRKGSAEAYKSDAFWGRFVNIVEKDFPDIPPILYIKTSSIKLLPKETAQLQHRLPSGANPDITYKTDDAGIATIDSKGVITAVAPGQTLVYVIPDGREDLALPAVVTVAEEYAKVDGITISGPSTVKVYDRIQLKADVSPAQTPWTDVVWSSDNRKVAIVDMYGHVSGVGEGSAVITATSTDGSEVMAKFTVNVNGVSGIESTAVAGEPTYKVNGTSVIVENARPHSVVRLYTIDGRLADTQMVSSQGEATVTSDTPGLFILNCLDTHKKLILN